MALPTHSDAASLTGQVVDANSAAVGNARVLLRRQDVTFEVATTTDQDGKFNFDDISQASYVLTVKGSGFASYEESIALGADVREVKITLQPVPL